MVEEGRVLGRRAGKCFQLASAFCKIRDGLRNHAKQRSEPHCGRKITQKMYDMPTPRSEGDRLLLDCGLDRASVELLHKQVVPWVDLKHKIRYL